jgi:hypothetical protein
LLLWGLIFLWSMITLNSMKHVGHYSFITVNHPQGERKLRDEKR